MKIINFKILRQTILLLLLLLISTFNLSAVSGQPTNCPTSSKVKAVRLKASNQKVLHIKTVNGTMKVMLELDKFKDAQSEFYMFTLPSKQFVKANGQFGRTGGQFLLYHPQSERFVCRKAKGDRREGNFIVEKYPRRKLCTFTESSSADNAHFQYKIGKTVLMNKNSNFMRLPTKTSCYCARADFHQRMLALMARAAKEDRKRKRKRNGPPMRHDNRLHYSYLKDIFNQLFTEASDLPTHC